MFRPCTWCRIPAAIIEPLVPKAGSIGWLCRPGNQAFSACHAAFSSYQCTSHTLAAMHMPMQVCCWNASQLPSWYRAAITVGLGNACWAATDKVCTCDLQGFSCSNSAVYQTQQAGRQAAVTVLLDDNRSNWQQRLTDACSGEPSKATNATMSWQSGQLQTAASSRQSIHKIAKHITLAD